MDKENCDEVVQGSRINIVPDIYSTDLNVLEYLCRAVLEDKAKLQILHFDVPESQFESFQLSLVDPELLSQAVIRLEDFRLDFAGSKLTPSQTNSIFTAICQSEDLKLKTLYLNLKDEDYSEISPELLASALVRLEETDILRRLTSPDHVECLLHQMAKSDVMKISEFDFNVVDTSNVSPEVLAEALVRVETVSNIPEDKVSATLSKIGSSDRSKVKSLTLRWLNLSSLRPGIVGEAVVKLELFSTVHVLNPNLATEMLTKIGDFQPLRLKELYMKHENLSSVSPAVLTQAACRLQHLELYNCSVSPGQLLSLFSQLAEGKCSQLVELSVGHSDVSQVPAEILVAATMRLKRMDIKGCEMRTEQLTALYEMVAERRSGSLEKLHLFRNNLTDDPSSDLQQAELNKWKHRAELNKSVLIF